MNNVSLTGRLTRNPELAKTRSNKDVVSFTIACNRIGSDDADFINCTVRNQQARYISSYAKKER